MGSTPTLKGRTSFFEMLGNVAEGAMGVFFHGNPWMGSAQSPNLDLNLLEPAELAGMRQSLGLTGMQQGQEGAAGTLDLKQLATVEEEKYQTEFLSPWGLKHSALDTHLKANASGLDFKFPKLVNGLEVFTNSALPDLTSTVLAMWFELKDTIGKAGTRLTENDWEVLKQALERVASRVRLSGFVRRVFCFAVTGFSAWLVTAFRNDNMEVTLSIWRLNHSDVEGLWCELTTAASKDRYFFFNADAPLICRSLTKIGLQPALCRVRFVAKSGSCVYAVTVPHKPMGFSLGVARTGSETFAIKVVHDGSEFQLEAQALRAMAATATPDNEFYALGSIGAQEEDSAAVWFASSAIPSDMPSIQVTEGWWQDPWLQTAATAGGCIIMRYADRRLHNEVKARDVAHGVMRSLELAHSVGISQCDLRPANILHFPSLPSSFSSSSSSSSSPSSSALFSSSGTWQLVDFGRCCFKSVDEYKLQLDVHSNQANMSGRRIRALVDQTNHPSGATSIDLNWTPQDDYQMLVNFLLEQMPK
jgi:hypothetical protein